MTAMIHRQTEHDSALAVTSQGCPRLAAELSVLTTMSHLDQEALEQRVVDHRRWHPCPSDWQPETGLPRDPRQETSGPKTDS